MSFKITLRFLSRVLLTSKTEKIYFFYKNLKQQTFLAMQLKTHKHTSFFKKGT